MYKSFSVSQLWCGAWLRLFQWHFLSLIRRFSTQHTRVERFLSIYFSFSFLFSFQRAPSIPSRLGLVLEAQTYIFQSNRIFNIQEFSRSGFIVWIRHIQALYYSPPTDKKQKKTLKLIWNNKRHSTLAAWAKSQLLPNAADFIYIFRLIHCRHRPVSWGFFKVQPCRPAVNCVNLRRSGFIISSHVVSV